VGEKNISFLVETLHKLCFLGPVWHNSASPIELFFGKQLHEQLHEQGRVMFLQLHHVLNSVIESFQRSWPESCAESWSFGY
jgi:2,4-dienoyl-CoA reductase-like NADH-dependent reductase (Old Yellow Enzyme family)